LSLKNRKIYIKTGFAVLALSLISGLIMLLINNSKVSTQFNSEGLTLSNAEQFQNQIAGREEFESNGLKMIFNGEEMVFSFHRNDGTEIYSSPKVKPEDELTALGRMAIKAPLEFEYVTQEGDLKSVTPITNPEIQITPYKIKDGVALEVNYSEMGIYFILETILLNGRVVVKVPFNSIKDSKSARLVSVSPFPMLGAARQGDSGYILLPDGSGSLTYFNRIHSIYEDKGFSKEVYGTDISFSGKEIAYAEQLRLPVYGIITKDSILTTIGTVGESDFKINMSPPGSKGINFYRTGFAFIYRKSYQNEISKGIFVAQYQKSIIVGDKEMEYDLSSPTENGYVTCADVYSDYLKNQGFKLDNELQDNILIRLFMAIKKGKGSLSDKNIVLTNSKQASSIADELIASGGKYSFELAGYQKYGYAAGLPEKYPVSKLIGGKNDLVDAIEKIKKSKSFVWLEDNYLDNYKGSSNITFQKTGVKTPEERFLRSRKSYPNGFDYEEDSHGYINAIFGLMNIQNELKQLSELASNGVNVKHIGQTVFTDFNKTNPLYKGQTIKAYLHQLEKLKKAGFAVGAQGANSYLLGTVSDIFDVPFETSKTYLLDESVPFYSLVASKFANCYSRPLNLEADTSTAILNSIEYGLSPKFEITHESAELLKNTSYEQLYSSRYVDYKDSILLSQKIVQAIGTTKLISHRMLDERVFESTYANGKKVIFNYSDSAYKYGELKKEALSDTYTIIN
jgi:hypothetical protein